MHDRETSFRLTQPKLTFALGLIAIATVGWNVFDYFRGRDVAQVSRDLIQDAKIDRNSRDVTALNANLEKLGVKTERLTDVMTRLTTVIENSSLTHRTLQTVPSEFQTPAFNFTNSNEIRQQ